MPTVNISITRDKVQSKEARVAAWSGAGLAVTRSVAPARGWTVTHLASGYAVVKGMRTAAVARQCAEALLECGDWQRSRTVVEGDTAFKAKVKYVHDTLRNQGLVA